MLGCCIFYDRADQHQLQEIISILDKIIPNDGRFNLSVKMEELDSLYKNMCLNNILTRT